MSPSTTVVAAILAIVLSWIITKLLYRWASQNLLDIPNERSSHIHPTPKGGGLSIVITSLLLLIGFTLVSMTKTLSTPILIYTVTGALIAGIGWIDDQHDLDARLRLLLQIAAAIGIMLATGGGVQAVALPVAGVISFPAALATFVNLAWLVGLINAYNFMDGIDGIAGTQAAIAGGAWFLLLSDSPVLQLLALLICFSSVGFLILNWPPAKIFMGDVGSTFLGLTLGALPLMAYAVTGSPDTLITGALFVAPFVFDSALTILRRLRNGENILKPHRSHLYQRLVKAGYSHTAVTSTYGFLMLICAGLGLVYYHSESLRLLVIVAVSCLCLALTISIVLIEKRKFAQQLS